ncbi:MAG: alpha/beta fold hydrolase [Alphaproteobacteria bacterium]|nr:alpha/beta fold hydrolase [Alphaproteobacteria bacterium]
MPARITDLGADAYATDLAVDGGALRVVRAGAAGPALVLLHGWTLDWRMWRPQIAAFSASHRVIALDRRGFGASSAPPDLAREAYDLIRVLDWACVERAIIIGMSQAGRVALDFALKSPGRVCGLVLHGAPLSGVTPGPGPEEMIPIVEYAMLAREGRLDAMKQLWAAHPLMRSFSTDAAQVAEAIVRDYEGRDLGAASYLRDAEPQDLAQITQPALVLTGALDTPWRRRAADALTVRLPNAERIDIAGGGHLCNLDQPEAYNAALRAFMAKIET